MSISCYLFSEIISSFFHIILLCFFPRFSYFIISFPSLYLQLFFLILFSLFLPIPRLVFNSYSPTLNANLSHPSSHFTYLATSFLYTFLFHFFFFCFFSYSCLIHFTTLFFPAHFFSIFSACLSLLLFLLFTPSIIYLTPTVIHFSLLSPWS